MRPAAATCTLAAIAAVFALATPAAAHHSFAMFDQTRTIAIEGEVKAFQWTNPHAEVVVLGGPPGAPPQAWSLELTSPSNLTRMGWTRTVLKAGDKVRIDINPLRSGEAGGALRTATIVTTGQVLTTRRLAGAPPTGAGY